jgi:hypothetical protein
VLTTAVTSHHLPLPSHDCPHRRSLQRDSRRAHLRQHLPAASKQGDMRGVDVGGVAAPEPCCCAKHEHPLTRASCSIRRQAPQAAVPPLSPPPSCCVVGTVATWLLLLLLWLHLLLGTGVPPLPHTLPCSFYVVHTHTCHATSPCPPSAAQHLTHAGVVTLMIAVCTTHAAGFDLVDHLTSVPTTAHQRQQQASQHDGLTGCVSLVRPDAAWEATVFLTNTMPSMG